LNIFNLELLSYMYHNSKVLTVFSNFIETGTLIFEFEEILSLISLLSIPFVVILITIIIFNNLDIRT